MSDHESDGDIITSLTYHKPDETALKKIEEICGASKSLARAINSLVPLGRCKKMAKTRLEECAMWAIKGFVLRGDQPPDPE